MSFVIRTSRKSEADGDVIFQWIVSRSAEGAQRWLNALEQAVQTLRTQADKCSLAPESTELGMELRQLIFRTRRGHPYRLLFVIRENTVHLTAIRGAGQPEVDWSDLELPG